MTTTPQRIAVITMVRSGEFPAAWSSLRTVEQQLGTHTQHFVLLNGPANERLESQLRTRPFTQLSVAGENLGVARGRNWLIRQALEWEAGLIISLDDDLIVPADYIERMSSRFAELSDSGNRVGVVMPVVLDFGTVANALFDPTWSTRVKAGQLDAFYTTDQLRRALQNELGERIPAGAMYHAGIRDWKRHYIDSYRGVAADVYRLYLNSRGQREAPDHQTELRLNSEVQSAVLTGDLESLPIDTAPGGACAFPAALAHAIGGVDEAFSPFGYEDSDFALRARSAGFHNYLLPSEMVLHDIENRSRSRRTAVLLHSQGRARSLLIKRHVNKRLRARSLAEVAALAPLQSLALSRIAGDQPGSLTGQAIGSATAYLAGFVSGLFAETQQTSVGTHEPSEISVAHRAQRRIQTTFRAWSHSPSRGLPGTLPLDIDVAYEFDPVESRFTLDRLIVDSPGLLRLTVRGELRDLDPRDETGNPDPLACSLSHAAIRVEDWGFLRRLETSVAWFRKESTTGYLAALARAAGVGDQAPVQRFLKLRPESAVYELAIRPDTPVTVAEMLDMAPDRNVIGTLGISSMAKTLEHY